MRLLFLFASLSAGAASGFAANSERLSVPLLFEENRGQAEAGAGFIARTPSADVLLGGAVSFATKASRYTLRFEGARTVAPQGESRLAAKLHYYRGPRSQWLENIPAFSAVRYRALYPGVDLLYHGAQGELEYDFQVAPYADPAQIRLRFEGAGPLRLSAEGDLIVETAAGGRARHKRPVAYQEMDGKRVSVPAWFRVRGNTVQFALAAYDRSRALVIDPILGFSTNINAQAASVAADTQGNTYLGTTLRLFGSLSNEIDAAYWKLDPAGRLVYKTYAGGLSVDQPAGIAVDGDGNLFATGSTRSSNFPASGSACSGGLPDAYILKLNSAGTIAASRCLGGQFTDYGVAIAVTPSGSVYVAGSTESPDFPTTSGAYQAAKKSNGQTSSGFAAKLDTITLATVYSTFIGSFGSTTIDQMGADASGAIVVSGMTSPFGFIPTPGAYLTAAPQASTPVPFALKLGSSGSSAIYATYLYMIADARRS